MLDWEWQKAPLTRKGRKPTADLGGTMASENLETVRRFCDAFSRRNPDEILEFFTDDAIYHNMPMPPVQSKAGIRTVLDMFLKPSDRSSSSSSRSPKATTAPSSPSGSRSSRSAARTSSSR